MIGDDLTRVLVVVYIALACVYGYELNFGKCLYFAGAAILTTGVLFFE